MRTASFAYLLLTTSTLLWAQTAALVRLTPSQSKSLCCKLDRSKLPPESEVRRFPNQEFLLHSEGSEDLAIVPVLIKYDQEPGKDFGPMLQCGVYLLGKQGRSQYIGMEWPKTHVGNATLGEDTCFGVDAVGLAGEPTSRPRLILLFYEETGAGPTSQDPYPVPYILRWNTDTGKYEIDAKPSLWAQTCGETYRGCGNTIPAVRKLLAEYDAKTKSGSKPPVNK